MKVIGLTGGISSGKSTVSRFLQELGAIIIDADDVGHEAFKPGTEAWREVVDVFGQQVLSDNGYIDRKKLGDMVFRNHRYLSRLNEIMHPRMFEIVRARLEEYRRRGAAVVVLEATLLLEASWTSLVDEVWVTVASEATVTQRLRERSGLTEDEARARISSQLPPAERVKHADVVINTDCSLEELRARVSKLWRQRLGKKTTR